MEVKKTYDDTILSLENHCNSRLKEFLREGKKQSDIIRHSSSAKGAAIMTSKNADLKRKTNYFQLPSMLQQKNHHEPGDKQSRIKRKIFANGKGKYATSTAPINAASIR